MDEEKIQHVSRREVRRQSRRDTILAVATTSFLEQGYAGTTMSGIAAALGGSKGTLWSYFSSKEDLFAAVIDHVTTAYRLKLTQILEAPCDDVRLTLHRICISLLERVVQPETMAVQRLVVAEAGRFPEMGTIYYDSGPRHIHKLVADFLIGAMQSGVLRSAPPLETARLLMGLCMSGCHQKLLWGVMTVATREQLEADVDRATDIFMRAYAA